MKQILLFAVPLLITACVSSSNYNNVVSKLESLEKENQTLKNKIVQLEKDLIVYKTDPDKLLEEAENAFQAKNDTKLLEIQKLFSDYHPENKNKIIVDGYVKKMQDIIIQYQKAQEKAAKEKEEQRLAAVKKLKKQHDDVEGITWYTNPYFTHYTNSNMTSLYIGQNDSNVWLRLKMSYYGENWIFFENAYLSYDGITQEILFDQYNDKKTENDSSVWEWIDVKVDEPTVAFFKKMVNGKEVKMRLSGKYAETRKLSQNEIKAIKDVLLAYDVLLSNNK